MTEKSTYLDGVKDALEWFREEHPTEDTLLMELEKLETEISTIEESDPATAEYLRGWATAIRRHLENNYHKIIKEYPPTE